MNNSLNNYNNTDKYDNLKIGEKIRIGNDIYIKKEQNKYIRIHNDKFSIPVPTFEEDDKPKIKEEVLEFTKAEMQQKEAEFKRGKKTSNVLLAILGAGALLYGIDKYDDKFNRGEENSMNHIETMTDGSTATTLYIYLNERNYGEDMGFDELFKINLAHKEGNYQLTINSKKRGDQEVLIGKNKEEIKSMLQKYIEDQTKLKFKGEYGFTTDFINRFHKKIDNLFEKITIDNNTKTTLLLNTPQLQGTSIIDGELYNMYTFVSKNGGGIADIIQEAGFDIGDDITLTDDRGIPLETDLYYHISNMPVQIMHKIPNTSIHPDTPTV